MKRLMLAVAVLAWSLGSLQNIRADQTADEAEIQKAVESYVSAFNQRDAQALAALWSPEAVYMNPATQEEVVGREAIEKQFAAIFMGEKEVKLDVTTDSIQFISPNVAVEHGVATLLRPNESPEESTYTAVYVKREGQWLLDRVTEEVAPVVLSNYEHLKELEWMIGTWVDQEDQVRIETTCQWTKNQNFMTRAFALYVRGEVKSAGMQIIGWDPAAKQIRSWVFDSDGAFGEGTWSKKDKSWHIHNVGTLPDGGKSTSVNILTYVDDDTFTWQSVNRHVGEELLPNIDEVIVVRQVSAN